MELCYKHLPLRVLVMEVWWECVFGKIVYLVCEGNGDAISEVTTVSGISTGTVFGLTMRWDEFTDALSSCTQNSN